MIRRFLANAVALAAAVWLIPGITVEGGDLQQKAVSILLVALVFGVVNALVKPIVSLLATPLILLTLGLFILVINMAMLLLTSWISGQAGWGFHVDGWWPALLGSLLISAVSWAVNGLFSKNKDRD